MNGPHQLVVDADNVNILYENINTMKKDLSEASREVGLEVNTGKVKIVPVI
jgi:hypothetical protein